MHGKLVQLAPRQREAGFLRLCGIVCIRWHSNLLCAASFAGLGGIWPYGRARLFFGSSWLAEFGSLHPLVVRGRRGSARRRVLLWLRAPGSAGRNLRGASRKPGKRLLDGHPLESEDSVGIS